MSSNRVFIGMDVHKATVVIAIAEPQRESEIRVLGTFPNEPDKILTQLRKLGKRPKLTALCQPV
jgi:transposase